MAALKINPSRFCQIGRQVLNSQTNLVAEVWVEEEKEAEDETVDEEEEEADEEKEEEQEEFEMGEEEKEDNVDEKDEKALG